MMDIKFVNKNIKYISLDRVFIKIDYFDGTFIRLRFKDEIDSRKIFEKFSIFDETIISFTITNVIDFQKYTEQKV